MFEDFLKESKSDMEKSFSIFLRDLSGVRTGRAHPSILESIAVNAHGSKLKMNHIANITVVSSKMLSINVWDVSLVGEINNAILKSNLGLTPIVEGKVIRVPIPDSTEERRRELIKTVKKYAEDTKQFLRNIRRKFVKKMEDMEETGEESISTDDLRKFKNKIQNLLNDMEDKVNQSLKLKEAEILEI